MAVSNPNDRTPSLRHRVALVRCASAAVVTLIVGAALVGGQIVDSSPAGATSSNALTVSWVGDSSTASAFQPNRSTSSPHYSELKNVAISVSQTSGIIDQAVRVSVTGFAGTKSSVDFGTNSQNYLQAMQCWGADPLAIDFRETCEWGGRVGAGNGLGNSVYFDNTLRVAARDANAFQPTTTGDVPFRTVDGQKISGKPRLVNGAPTFDVLNLFGPSTTNEVTSARVGANGTGYFDFETQTADQAPQLGCGTAAHLRCWLVVIPRGTAFGGAGDACSGLLDPANNYEVYTYGRKNSAQGGSPLNPGCDYWNNRINIPLDFSQVGSVCPIGSAEQRVVGSQLMVGAMSSWQPSLCKTVKTTFSFSTNPDAIAREQVLENTANSPAMAYMGFPISAAGLSTSDQRDLLARTKLSYAPVAISAVVVAFLAEFDAGRQEQLILSPRMMAKLLTQSYKFTVPWNTTDASRQYLHLPTVNQRYSYLNDDPEFRALNPTNYNQFTSNPAIVLPGPSGADAIRQVWRWILADKDAVSFMDGTPDPWGMSVNPYYLPKGDPKAVVPWWLDDQGNYNPVSVQRLVGLTNLDGTPQKLSDTPLDTFPKDDESLVPLNRTIERTRFDSIQFSPYTDNLLSGARQAFRADPNSKTSWDPNKLSLSGLVGDWVSSGVQVPGQKFMIAITDSPSAIRYSLSTASLQLDNSSIAMKPDAGGMSGALSALTATSLDVVKQVDPSRVASGGYPLTMITYAGVNVSRASATSRAAISSMITQVTTSGQVSGSGIGQLPEGYLPLTGDLVTQASKSALDIQTFTSPANTPPAATPSTNGIAQDDFSTSSTLDTLVTATKPEITKSSTQSSAATTEAGSTQGLASSGLVIALGVGLAGFLIAPILFRGKGFL